MFLWKPINPRFTSVVRRSTFVETTTNPMPPICKDCKYFKEDKIFDNKLRYLNGKCLYKGRMNVVSGEIEYGYAETMRMMTDNNSCGVNGRFFVKK
jgi:hypothetical protein